MFGCLHTFCVGAPHAGGDLPCSQPEHLAEASDPAPAHKLPRHLTAAGQATGSGGVRRPGAAAGGGDASTRLCPAGAAPGAAREEQGAAAGWRRRAGTHPVTGEEEAESAGPRQRQVPAAAGWWRRPARGRRAAARRAGSGDAMGCCGASPRPFAPLLPLLVLVLAVLAVGVATSQSQPAGASAMGSGTPPSPSSTAFEETRLHVFTLDYPHVQIPFEITLWILLASLAKIGERGRRVTLPPSPSLSLSRLSGHLSPGPASGSQAAAVCARRRGRGCEGSRRLMRLLGTGCSGVICLAEGGVFSVRKGVEEKRDYLQPSAATRVPRATRTV